MMQMGKLHALHVASSKCPAKSYPQNRASTRPTVSISIAQNISQPSHPFAVVPPIISIRIYIDAAATLPVSITVSSASPNTYT